MSIQRGSSGARLEIGDWSVVKRGNRRVGEQGRWLVQHHAPSLPMVTNVSDIAYTMERLTQPPVHLFDTKNTLHEVKALLERDVWSHAAKVKFEMFAHLKRLDPLPIDARTARLMYQARSRIGWDELKACTTHGDPILDNVLIRSTGALVITDPIPATEAIPDLRCVDIGRLMQSAAGYEKYRYASISGGPTQVSPRTLVYDWGLDENEVMASLYFAAVHCLRSMVYVDGSTAEAIKVWVLAEVLDELRELM